MIGVMGNPFLLRCERCGHEWVATRVGPDGKPILPKTCANKACHSPYWNKPKMSKRALAKASSERATAYWESQREE